MNGDRKKIEFRANALRGAATLHEIVSFFPTSSPEGNKELCDAIGRAVITDAENLGALLTYAMENLSGEI